MQIALTKATKQPTLRTKNLLLSIPLQNLIWKQKCVKLMSPKWQKTIQYTTRIHKHGQQI